jgi:hypothetical protein
MAVVADPAVQTLTSIAERLTVTGMYSSPEQALVEMALAQIDREIADVRAEIEALQKKYRMTFEEFTESLRGRATMGDEIVWEEWDDLRLKLAIRQESKEAILSYAASLD